MVGTAPGEVACGRPDHGAGNIFFGNSTLKIKVMRIDMIEWNAGTFRSPAGPAHGGPHPKPPTYTRW